MIVEMRTTLVRPMTQKKVEERFAQALPERQKLSPLGGFFHTDVGTLNQIIELWPYDNMAQREDVQARNDRGQGTHRAQSYPRRKLTAAAGRHKVAR